MLALVPSGRSARLVLLLSVLGGCGDSPTESPPASDPRILFDLRPLGAVPYPADNPRSEEKVELGRLLFFDPILSGERDVSCATCHHPAFAFADGRARSIGAGGTGLGPDRTAGSSSFSGDGIREMARNAPTVLNAALHGSGSGLPSADGLQFWDGRARGLEEQALLPIAARDEMRGDAYPEEVALDSVLARLRAIPEYVERFGRAFSGASDPSGAMTPETLAMALATYQRELVGRAARFDRYVAREVELTPVELAGLELFFDRGSCTQCHGGPMFSGFDVQRIGAPQTGPGGATLPGDDLGREEHSGLVADRRAFAVPSLRNVALTAPYMHSGAFETLEDVVRFYSDDMQPRHPAVDDEALSPQLPRNLGLTSDEIGALVAFLETLTDPGTELAPELVRVPDRVPSGLQPVSGVGG